jgi:hypothetical protein
MGISRRVGVAISGLAFAGAAALTIGTAGPAGAQATNLPAKHRHWTSVTVSGGTYTYDSWERWWGWGGCGCCC